MKIFCCYTDAHEVLFRRHFIPSLPADCQLHATRVELAGPGDFLSPEYLACLRLRVDLIRESLRANPGEVLVWSDVDIFFARPLAAELRALMGPDSGPDILFQSETLRGNEINAGFFVCRAGPRLEAFFDLVGAQMDQRHGWHDQNVINALLPGLKPTALRWGYLPASYYARTHGWPPPGRSMALYHANDTPGIDGVARKLSQFRELSRVRRWGWPALAMSCAAKIPRRWSRVVAERRNREKLPVGV